MRKLALALVVLAVASASYGSMVYSWENDAQAWNLAAVTSYGFSTEHGVTDGAYSLELLVPGADNSWSLYQLKHNSFPTGIVNEGTIVSFDVTTNASNVWVGQMIQGGSPWYASGAIGYTDCSSPDGSYVTTTVSYDFSAITQQIADSVVSGAWAEHRIIIRGDNSATPSFARTVFIDNYRVTPEPAMMSLLGLGGLALLRRRK